MKLNTLLVPLVACMASALFSGSLLSSAHAGGGGDDVVIFRSTQSERSTRYFQTSVQTPDAKVREGNRATSYVILNLATGEFRELRYWTETHTDPAGRRSRVKLFRADRFDRTPAAMFQTGPGDRKNYLILSLYGTGIDGNYSFFQNGNYVSSYATSETLAGVMRLQRIRTALGIVECMAPSTIRGALGYESHNSEPDGRKSRRFTTGRKTLRLDKRRIAEAKATGALSLGEFQGAAVDYLLSRGYQEEVL